MQTIETSDSAAVSAAAIAICTRGVVLGDQGFSAGAWTPAVADGFAFAVLNRQGSPILLCHDAFEAARAFCAFEAGEMTPPEEPFKLWTDARREEDRLWDAWMYEYRFSNWGGYGKGGPGAGLQVGEGRE